MCARIAIDLDSTLYDFETAAREAFLKLAEREDDRGYFRGAYNPWMEWRSPTDACGLDKWLEAIAMCHDADAIRQQVPYAGAVETCQALAAEGHILLYISNRATESTAATHDWLTDWGFLSDPAHELVCTMGAKEPYLHECQYIIDDRPKTTVQFVYDRVWANAVEKMVGWAGEDRREETERNWRRRAFVKAYQYNQNLTDIPGLYLAPTWSGLNYYLVSKGVLSKPAVTPTLKV